MTRAGALPALTLLAAVGLLLTQCTTGSSIQPAAPSAATGTDQGSVQPVTEAQNAPAALASADAPNPDYSISPRDIIEVSVFQVPDYNKTVQVGDDGNITLPLIGRVPVKGQTTQEAADIIAKKLGQKYMQSPQVSVFVKTYGQRVVVNGEVKTPRVMAVEGQLTLTQAIASAGGLSDLADSKRIHIARAANGRVQDTVYNLNEIQGGKVNDPILHGGDIVVAEQSGVQVAIKNVKDMLPFAVLATIL